MLAEALRVAVDQLEELAVPFLVVEAGALADHLVREPAGADHRHLEVLGIGLGSPCRSPGRACSSARGFGSGCWSTFTTSGTMRAGQSGCDGHIMVSGECSAVVERQVLEDRQVELVVDQRARDVARQRRVALERRDLAHAQAFVRDGVLVAHAEREGRVVVEEERGGVVVEAEEEHVGLLLRQPFRHRLVALEERRQSGSFCLPLSNAIAIVGTCEVPMPPMMRAMPRFYPPATFAKQICNALEVRRWYADRSTIQSAGGRMKVLWIAAALAVTGTSFADEALRRDAAARFGALQAPWRSALGTGRARPRALLGHRASRPIARRRARAATSRATGARIAVPSRPIARGALTSRHSPPVFNTMSLPALRWLSDRKSGAEQAEGSLTGSLGFASKEAAAHAPDPARLRREISRRFPK